MDALTWEDLLGQPLGDAVRVVVRHDRVRRFRWLFLVELALFLVLLSCLIPLWIVGSLFAGEPLVMGLGNLDERVFRWEHRLRLQLFARDGAVLHERVLTVTDDGERDRLVASVLQAADRDRMVVVQTLGTTWLATFYGGRPLMAPPQLASVDEALRTLGSHPGVEVERGADHVSVQVPAAGRSWLLATFALLVLTPFRVLSRSGREALADDWRTFRRADPTAVRVEVRASGVRWGQVRGGDVAWEDVAGGELVAVAWSQDLGGSAVVRPPRLRLVGRSGAVHAPVPLNDTLGALLADLVRAATLELRARHPALGLQFTLEGESHCGHCGTLYDLGASERCPSCGAPPTFRR